MSKLTAAFYGVTFIAALGITTAQVAPILDDVEGTTNTLIAQGYEPVDVGGGVWLGGSQGDFWRTQFTAVNPHGALVEGYATTGIFKGVTIRDVTLAPDAELQQQPSTPAAPVLTPGNS